MKYTLTINQKQAIDAGIKNVSQAIVLDLLTSCSTWASPIEHKGKIYYWVSRQSICRELPILNMQPDTAYRHLKALAEFGLIDYQKSGKKDLIRLTSKGKKYHSSAYVGKKSEFSGDEDRPSESTQEQEGLASPECDSEAQKQAVSGGENNNNPYVGKKSEFCENAMSENNPKNLGFKSESARKKIRHISNTRSIRNTNDHAGEGNQIETLSEHRFPMHDDWQPSSDHFPVLCRRGGLADWQTYHTQETLTEFILYWSGQPSELTQYNWELKYLKQLQRSKANGINKPNSGQGAGKSKFIDESDTSFLEDDPELRQAVGLSSNR